MKKTFIKEPLLHFLLISLLIFLTFDVLNPPNDKGNVITISDGRIAQLHARFQKTWQRPPTDDELSQLVRNYALDEIYNQEARALDLDKNDAVIKRRLRQKMEFMLQEMSPTNASKDEIESFYQRNKEKYQLDSRYSFEQVFISVDRNQDELDTILAAQKIQIASGAKPVGDKTLLPTLLVSGSTSELERLFGTLFLEALVELKTDSWQGPVRSGIGIHFVHIEKVERGLLPALDTVYEKVLNDWKYQQNHEAKINFEEDLLERYEIRVEGNFSKQQNQ